MQTSKYQSYPDVAIQLYGDHDTLIALLDSTGLATGTAAGEIDLAEPLIPGQQLPDVSESSLRNRQVLRALNNQTVTTYEKP